MKTQCSFCGGLKRHTINCLWHDPDAEFRRDPMSASYASDVRLSNWKIVVILSIGLLSAFGAGVGLVWLWGCYVVACS